MGAWWRQQRPKGGAAWRAFALLLALALVATACNGDDDDDVDLGPGPDETPIDVDDDEHDPEGVLRFGTDLTILGADRATDPAESRSVGDFLHLQLIYDTLLRARPDGEYEPGLAESWEVLDDSSVELTLREGLTFHDGSPLDAEAVQFSIQRNIDAENRNHAPQITEIESVEVQDERTLVIQLSTPTVGSFFELLAGRETMPVSPAAADDLTANPVGAGPYQFERLDSEQVLSLRKFEEHWEADEWLLAGIDFVHAPAGPPRVNTLLADEVDMVDLQPHQSPDLEGRPGIVVEATTSDADFVYIATCKDREPFDDLTFRQAVSHALDRDEINDALLHGQGEPMWSLWPAESRFHTPDLDGLYGYDPEQAQELLAEAGYPDGLDLGMTFPAGNAVLERAAEILQAQLGAVGINVSLQPSADIVTDFYQNVQTPAAASFWIRPGLQKVTRAFGPDSVANVCDYSDPTVDELAATIAAMPPDAPELEDAWDEMNRHVMENVLWNFVAWQPIVHAWNEDRVGGVEEVLPQLQGPNFRTIFVRS